MAKHLLILDLDETLFHASKNPLEYRADFRIGDYHAYKRPHLHVFLERAEGLFDLAVWTSATADYAEVAVQNIFAKLETLKFIWSRERCTQGYNPETFEHYWIKDLKKVRRRGFSLGQVIVLDDSPEKLERNYGNLLRIKPYWGDKDDTELIQVQTFLEHLSQQEDIRQVEKRYWQGAYS